MKFKIACPNCAHSLTLNDPKVGKYKPTCSKCSSAFAIVVEAGDPPKIRVGKLSTKPVEQQLTSKLETPKKADLPSVAATNLEATLPPATSTQPAVSDKTVAWEPEETKPPVVPSSTLPNVSKANNEESWVEAPKTSGFDATLAGDAITKPQQEDVTVGFERTVNKPAVANTDFTIDHETIGATGQSPKNTDFSVAPGAVKQPSAESPSQKGNRKATPTDSQVERLGGYKIIQELGAGGMGKVYLASQVSLDRKCAVKTIQAEWAKNPKAVARFIREAYAAAQLTHHNVVQIYDLGQENGTNYFSMELVSGGSLDEQLKKKGKLPPKLAATLILQAARGLKFAHDHGMVHRDIKPANLMLTADGLVKIADMGLIKTPHSEETKADMDEDQQALMLASARSQFTLAGASMGTPAYMSPEQAEDAAGVDKRADIYSLGCTFYALLTGRPPFDGATLLEVITKHRQEKITRPEVIVTGLQPKLGDIIERMTEKNPDDRYQDLEEVIEDIEVFLELREDLASAKIQYFDARDQKDVDSASHANVQQQAGSEAKGRSVATPSELPAEAVAKIQEIGKSIGASPLRLAQRFLPAAWLALCGSLCLLALLLALWSGVGLMAAGAKSLASAATDAVSGAAGGNVADSPNSASGSQAATYFASMTSRFKSALICLLTLVLAPLFTIILAGREGKSVIAGRYRQSLLTGGWGNIAYAAFAAIATVLLVHFFGLWITAIVALVLGAAAGAGYYYGIQRPIDAQSQNSIETAQAVIKQLRLQGADEQVIQSGFVKHAGARWEELFEGLFGYDGMRAMRSRIATGKKSAKWSLSGLRDRLIDRLEVQVSDQKRADEQRMLAQAEKAELIAAGVSAADAKKRADEMAASMVEAATETRKTMQEIAAGQLTEQAAAAKRQRIKQMLAEARSGKVSKPSKTSRAMQAILNQLAGGKCRLAIAVVLLLLTGVWINQNQQSLERYWQQTKSSVSKIAQEGVENVAQNVTESTQQALAASAEHRWQPVLAGMVTHKNVIFVGLAGLFMLWGAFFAGWKPSLFFVPITLAILAVPMFI